MIHQPATINAGRDGNHADGRPDPAQNSYWDLDLLTPDDVCALLKVKKSWLYDAVENGAIEAIRLGKGGSLLDQPVGGRAAADNAHMGASTGHRGRGSRRGDLVFSGCKHVFASRDYQGLPEDKEVDRPGHRRRPDRAGHPSGRRTLTPAGSPSPSRTTAPKCRSIQRPCTPTAVNAAEHPFACDPDGLIRHPACDAGG